MNPHQNSLLTITTDFGESDSYVAQMKGVIYGINPHCFCVDVTHQVEPQNILRAAYILNDIVKTFPKGTVHLVVVDPGVGTARSILALEIAEQFFVLPDNGLLTVVAQQYSINACIELRTGRDQMRTVSNTFHGRDIMAPAAATLSLGMALSELGPEYRQELHRITIPQIGKSSDGLIGEVLWVDRFGNLITNIVFDQIAMQESAAIEISVGENHHCALHACYSDVKPGELLAYVGSSQHLEIAIRNGSAVNKLGIGQGAGVKLKYMDRL